MWDTAAKEKHPLKSAFVYNDNVEQLDLLQSQLTLQLGYDENIITPLLASMAVACLLYPWCLLTPSLVCC